MRKHHLDAPRLQPPDPLDRRLRLPPVRVDAAHRAPLVPPLPDRALAAQDPAIVARVARQVHPRAGRAREQVDVAGQVARGVDDEEGGVAEDVEGVREAEGREGGPGADGEGELAGVVRRGQLDGAVPGEQVALEEGVAAAQGLRVRAVEQGKRAVAGYEGRVREVARLADVVPVDLLREG